MSITVCSSGKIVGLWHALHVTTHPEVDGVKMDGRRCPPKYPEGEGCTPVEPINDGGREPENIAPRNSNYRTFIKYSNKIYK
ncbi:unnamed protein product [Litomosoides sigmodontis]|uniref:Uncharacterized protein n=1 Tax=Litomosoides sigmodontis TaxID=42156 RepID=A0A3P6T5U6_LITSI|nr:unnamed protein product [Litomosoides sigmodontis]